METKKVNILGTEYTVEFKNKNDDELLKDGYEGYCDKSVKKLTITDFEREKTSLDDLEYYKKQVARHEVVHAFLNESGLQGSGQEWTANEQMVDWIAIQAPKMIEVFKKLEII